MIQEFKKFIMRGNVVDLAVGIIIGAAFKGVTTSLVKDVITPPIGLVLNNFNFDDLFISLNGQFYPTLKDALDASAPIIKVGSFINVCIDFLITAVAIFFLIKFVNRMEDVIEDLTDDDADEEVVEATPEPEPVPEPEPTTEERLLEVLEKLSAQLDKA
ncbi:MAG: large conductance mechanosensitive channel protein MscL [Chloroflexi bacterium]|nr:large conductance mechanosensitive channel protein MscL [Chloroflexota bacterium]MCY3583673.1 large conductance mechanosensitive channel protein MscL [Chloroflexota bacterium]MCY3716953.1 large conductance mechanosensitive channel protein MscL [Chloroflexota bacterium]MDE2650137.1 large conductance mechanosensitive channel protein MscL [Chloroflexota bacterium]MXV92851.1 large conductance mechanosensitive channel protein MscL [Chloroflexota bacterium]